MSSLPHSSSTNTSNNLAYQDAIQRAQQVASKLKSGREESSGSGVGAGDRGAAGAVAGIKRSSSDSVQGPQTKRFSMENGTMSEQITVPDKMVGMIIGRGGEQITRLQQESGCKIQMAPDSGGQAVRMCTLTGKPESIAQAKALIDGVVANNGNMMGGGGGGGGSGAGVTGGGVGGGNMNQGGGQPGLFELMVPGHKVGLVIGKGGETIKTLQEQTGAKIIIIQENSDHADQKPLRITGPPAAVQMAQARIMELLNQLDQRHANGFAGRGRGGGAPSMRGSPRGGFAGRGRGRGMSGWPGGNDGSETVDYIVVTSDKVGLVIGKGGETIKSINQASGAHCEIDKRAPTDATEKNFVIRGTAESVEKAKQMVLEKIGAAPGSGYGSFPGQTFTQNEVSGMYGGHTGPQGGGYNPSGPAPYEQTQNPYQPQPTAGGGQGPQGQQDFSAQWIEYYRSLGMTKEAELIEQQAAASGGGHSAQTAPAPPTPQSTQPQSGGGPDYSAQWAEYYRSMGKIKEAEAIEAQMRAKSGGQVGFGGATQGAYPGQLPSQHTGQPAQPGYTGQGYYPPQQF